MLCHHCNIRPARKKYCSNACVAAAEHLRNPTRKYAENAAYAQARQDYVNKIKEASPCADCGQKFHPVCMDFDHRDQQSKTLSISQMCQRRCSILTIEAEIVKCDLVCANCHRLRTWITKRFKPRKYGTI